MESPEPEKSKKETTYEFDTLKIDAIIKEESQYKETESSLQSTFIFSNKDEKQSSENNTKYISEITTNSFKYIGYLSENLTKEFFGYYKYDNNDEYSGEWKNDFKEGNGVYLYYNEKDKNEEEFYFGNWDKGEKNGKGFYFWKHSNEDVGIEKSDYDVIFGIFEKNEYKNGICISKSKNDFSIYEGKYLNEKKNDDEAFFFENEKCFLGKFVDNEMIEGRIIIFKNKDDIKNCYYFNKTNDEKNPYNFEYKKMSDKDDSIKERKKKFESLNYESRLPEIFNFMKQFIKDSSSLKTMQEIKFKDESIDKFIEYLNFN
jgi:hypothetical protein